MSPDQELRRALGALTVRERDALLARVRQSAEKWEPSSPRLAAAQRALADVIEDVSRLARARLAAAANEEPMRFVERGRR